MSKRSEVRVRRMLGETAELLEELHKLHVRKVAEACTDPRQCRYLMQVRAVRQALAEARKGTDEEIRAGAVPAA
jgi:hypothetical protein